MDAGDYFCFGLVDVHSRCFLSLCLISNILFCFRNLSHCRDSHQATKCYYFSFTSMSAPPSDHREVFSQDFTDVCVQQGGLGFCFCRCCFFIFVPSSTLFEYAWEASQMADGGLVGRIALSLSLYYALPY